MENTGQSGGIHGYQYINPQQQQEPITSSGTNNNTAAAGDKECLVREQDRFMPIANVIRLMRRIIPSHAKISDDAKEIIQECVSEFISFVTSEANTRCQQEQRKTITAEDVLWAMSTLGFDDFIEPLTIYLTRFREIEGGERCAMRGEPYLRRSIDQYGAVGMANPFVPAAYYMGPNSELLGAMAMGSFMNNGQNTGSSAAGANSAADPNVNRNE